MDFVELETKRLQLVRLNTSHLNQYFTIMSKQEVMEYYGMEPLTKKEDAALIFATLDRGLALGQSIRWGITLKESGQLIGTVGLNNLSLKSKRAEIGYEIHPDFWRLGYATEAIISVVNYSFHQLDLFRIGAITYPANTSSNHLLLKMGFTLEGTLRGYLYQRNQSHDAYVFSITKPEWKH
ncbi:GNAT family N-acetyltransferase [Pradoshia sp. D12]|uniref:GNAT family N-acetyltransferase n=1 Tax=Bacillaceae TaxID=186817 RepID=UPI00080AD8AC|nr:MULTISPECIES: GNAT family protein [Bacillaceae]OCA89432.1 acetyltransferase [Bacillus sp. FJAT-27986]QFK71186.1 GNAT family N-acetyltransferase [Pradoshia sp. D12]TPF72979.1 GNAT family N-acetyltransferase [Bacillus sp. D12]